MKCLYCDQRSEFVRYINKITVYKIEIKKPNQTNSHEFFGWGAERASSNERTTNENFKLNKIAIDYLKMHIVFDVAAAFCTSL